MKYEMTEIKYKLPEVSFNRDELKAIIDTAVAPLRGFTSPEDIKHARGRVRVIIKEFDDQRKDITRMWDTRKKEFMADVNHALESATQLEEEYKAELDRFEEERKAERHAEIVQMDGAHEYLKYFEMPDTWLKKSTKLTDIDQAISEGLEKIKTCKLSITQIAKLQNLDPERYILLLEKQPYENVLQRINEDAELKAEPKEEVQLKNEIATISLKLKGDTALVQKAIDYAKSLGIEVTKI